MPRCSGFQRRKPRISRRKVTGSAPPTGPVMRSSSSTGSRSVSSARNANITALTKRCSARITSVGLICTGTPAASKVLRAGPMSPVERTITAMSRQFTPSSRWRRRTVLARTSRRVPRESTTLTQAGDGLRCGATKRSSFSASHEVRNSELAPRKAKTA